jgi:phage tail sheath gpL-like
MAWYKRLEATYEGAAALAGAIGESLLSDPGQPLHRIPLAGISALAASDRWTMVERNQLGLAGISSMDDSVGPQTYSVVTMSLKNGSGVTDTTYQQVLSVYVYMISRYRFWNQIASKYGRSRLGNSSQGLRSGISIITPAQGVTEALIWYAGLITDGLAEDYATFKANVRCVRSSTNQNRLEWLLPENIMNQFIVGSATIQLRN